MTVTFMRIYSWSQLEFLRAARRVSLPAATARAAPVELARLEAAGFTTVAREAPGVPVHEAAHELEIAPLVGRAGGDDLRLEQPVEAEQRRVAPQFVAHELIRLLVALRFQRLLEHGVEKVERRIALEVVGEQAQPLFRAARLAVGLEQALRGQREIGRVLRLDALPLLDRLLGVAGVAFQIAELQAGAHAFAVRFQRGLQVLARRVGPRLRRLGRGELAVVLRELA